MNFVRVSDLSTTATVTIDRQDKLNALSSELLRELLEVFCGFEARPPGESPRAVVLTGAGRAFAAGADIGELSKLSPREARELSQLGHRLGRAMEEAPFPIIAAIQGVALGGGLELALATDYLFASENARLGQPEVGLGLIPGFGGTFRLAERVGMGWARRLIYTGEVLEAPRALELGLVDNVVAPDSLLQAASALATSIASRAPLAVAAAKRSILRARTADRAQAAEYETLAFSGLFASEDARAGLLAFVEKRTTEFKGQ